MFTKEDLDYVQSKGHQDLANKGEPKTSAASRGKRARAAARERGSDEEECDDEVSSSKKKRK